MSYDVAALRRAEFPITEQKAYFNNCGISPLPRRSAQAAHEFLDAYMLGGTAAEMARREMLERTRTKMAALINASPDEVAFVKNTSEGLGIVAQAVPWEPGDVVLVAEGEFPAAIYPWRGLPGVELVMVPAPDERITPEIFAPYLERGNVRLVVASWVQFHTGWRTDLAALGALAHTAGALFCADIIQGLGGLPFDVRAADVDFCTWGGNKWLLSLQGAGGLYVNRQLWDNLRPANVGWLGVAWDQIEDLDPTRPLQNRAARYEEGTRPNICLTALERSLDLLAELGPYAIADQIKSVSDALAAGLAERGATLRSQRDGDHWSGIVAWTHPDLEMHAVAAALEAADVMITIREGSLRAAPHGYNTIDDVERLLAVIDTLR